MKKELKEFLLRQQFEGDSTEGDAEKKNMIRSLMRIFTLILNTKVDSVNKVKKILKIAINTTLRLWSGQK